VSRRYVAFAPDLFATRYAKTAHGAIAYGSDPVVAVIDPALRGRRVRDVLPYLASDAPIVGDLASTRPFAPTALLLGTAPLGGVLPEGWRSTVVEALTSGLDVVSGLHAMLGEDPEFAAAARVGRATISDVRAAPPPRLFTGAAFGVRAVVLLTVGSDAAVGKMTAALELTAAARAAGTDAHFVATGQTGIVIAGRGTAIDRTIADFSTGAVEELVVADGDAELLVVEGQGGIAHPAFAPVTLALLYGSAPDALLLVHRPTRERAEGFATPIPPLRDLVALYEALCATVKPARVIGVALNTGDLDAAAAEGALVAARAATGLPCADLVRGDAAAFYAALRPMLAGKGSPR